MSDIHQTKFVLVLSEAVQLRREILVLLSQVRKSALTAVTILGALARSSFAFCRIVAARARVSPDMVRHR